MALEVRHLLQDPIEMNEKNKQIDMKSGIESQW